MSYVREIWAVYCEIAQPIWLRVLLFPLLVKMAATTLVAAGIWWCLMAPFLFAGWLLERHETFCNRNRGD